MSAIQFVAESFCIISRRFARQPETAAQSGFGVGLLADVVVQPKNVLVGKVFKAAHKTFFFKTLRCFVELDLSPFFHPAMSIVPG
jgi:hypothetical protein